MNYAVVVMVTTATVFSVRQALRLKKQLIIERAVYNVADGSFSMDVKISMKAVVT